MDVTETIQHVHLVGTKDKDNLTEWGMFDGETQCLIDVGCTVKPHPTQIHVTIAEKHPE